MTLCILTANAATDPTFSDANWVSMNPRVAGTDQDVTATAVDALGNLFVGGWFTVVGDIPANHIACWNGTNWLALGSGIGGV